jgi:predicted choloylglycine hydrolase
LYSDTADVKLNKVKFKYLHKLAYLDYLNINTPLYTEEFFYKPSLFNLLNFTLYNNESTLDTLDDNYENLKNFKSIYTGIYQNLYMSSFKYVSPMTYTAILDAYRANYDEYN